MKKLVPILSQGKFHSFKFMNYVSLTPQKCFSKNCDDTSVKV